jgi:hypothetical protein
VTLRADPHPDRVQPACLFLDIEDDALARSEPAEDGAVQRSGPQMDGGAVGLAEYDSRPGRRVVLLDYSLHAVRP